MECQLSISRELGTDKQGRTLRSPVTHVLVETDLGHHSSSGFPPSFVGRLKDVSLGQILDLKCSPGIEAIFRGSAYKFEEIAKDGSFILRRC
jgi:hypothetical protein